MSLKKLKIELIKIENEFEKLNFEDFVKEGLEISEELSFDPYEERTKSEIQKDFTYKAPELYENYKLDLINRAREIEVILNEAQALQHLLNELEKTDIIPTTKTIIKHNIYIKNVNIFKKQGKYPEEATENYWAIGIDINNMSEAELQTLSIFDKDFW